MLRVEGDIVEYEYDFGDSWDHRVELEKLMPAAPDVTIDSPIVQGFADAAAGGLPRPQNVQLNNFWGAFGDALNLVLDKGEDPTTAVANACTNMNEANGL